MAKTRVNSDVRVEFEGLREFRKDLARMEGNLSKEVRLILKEASEMVAQEARSRAPKRSGRLAASIKAGTSGDRALIRSSLPYFPVHEFGGTVGRGRVASKKGSGSVTIKRREMVYGAISAKRMDAERIVLKGIDKLGRQAGFH